MYFFMIWRPDVGSDSSISNTFQYLSGHIVKSVNPKDSSFEVISLQIDRIAGFLMMLSLLANLVLNLLSAITSDKYTCDILIAYNFIY